MNNFQIEMMEYKRQMQMGIVPRAYSRLMDFMSGLKTYLKKKYLEFNVSGNLYLGYMDMTYFSFFPDSLKEHKLKTGIVFIHESCHFEAWLFGVNKQVQKQYWQRFKDSDWDQFQLVASTEGEDAILTHVVSQEPDFGDLKVLNEEIERETVKFIKEIEKFLLRN